MAALKKPLLLATLGVFAFAAGAPKAEACMFGLFGCRHKSKKDSCATTANYVAPCTACAPPVQVAACAPQPIAVTQTVMQQRSYLAPVTVMETRTAVEPVTTYQTSTYLEPVTTMRTSAYYDPCNCGYTTVQTPVTSYVQKQQVTPVTSYVQRHYQVPVTRYEQRTVMEPVTQTRLYYPAQTVAIPAAVPVVAAPAVAAVPAPVPAAAAPLAMPTPGQAQYLTPVPAGQAQPGQPQTSQYQQPQTPQSQQPGAGNVVERNYQTPNGSSDRTTLIERIYRNGQIVEEKTRYLQPGEQLPPPRGPEQQPTSKSSFNPPAAPDLLKPIPVERTAWLQPRQSELSNVQWTAAAR